MTFRILIPSLVCVFMFVGNVSATYFFFDGGGGDSLWTNPDNWGSDEYPGQFDPRDVVIARTGNNKRALITDGMYIALDFITSWSTPGAQVLNDGFDMTGGTLELVGASGKLEMGSNETNIPIEVNVSGGTIYGKNFSLGGIHGGSPPVDSDAVWNVSGTAVIDFSNGGGYIGGWHPDALDSTGTLNMSGDATLLASGFYLSAQGNGFVTLADNAKITVLGDHYDSLNAFITSGNITAAAGGGVNVSYDSDLDQTLIALGAAGGGLSGDYNGDGGVDAADYTVYQDNLGGDSSVLNGNGSGEATVVQADYDLWTTNFGTGSTSASAAVPEPATGSLAVITFMVLVNFSRRRIGR